MRLHSIQKIRQKPADKGLQPYGYGESASAKNGCSGGIISHIPSAVMDAGFAFGVPLIAVVYDVTGTYKIAWILVAVLALLMTALLLYSAAQCRKHAEVSS